MKKILVTAVWGVTTLVTMKMEQKDKKEERAGKGDFL